MWFLCRLYNAQQALQARSLSLWERGGGGAKNQFCISLFLRT